MKVVLILSFFVLTACAVTVKTYQKPDQSFDDFETWCWLEGCEVTYQGPDYLYDKKVEDEIANAVKYMELNPIYDKKEIWNGVAKAMKKLTEKE